MYKIVKKKEKAHVENQIKRTKAKVAHIMDSRVYVFSRPPFLYIHGSAVFPAKLFFCIQG